MLVDIVKREVLINLLLPMEWCGHSCHGSEVVGPSKGPLALLEVLKPNTVHIKWVPADLTLPVMRVTVKGRNNPAKM